MLRSHDGDGPTGTRVSFGGASQISILPVLQSSSRLFSVLCRILLVLAQRYVQDLQHVEKFVRAKHT